MTPPAHPSPHNCAAGLANDIVLVSQVVGVQENQRVSVNAPGELLCGHAVPCCCDARCLAAFGATCKLASRTSVHLRMLVSLKQLPG